MKQYQQLSPPLERLSLCLMCKGWSPEIIAGRMKHLKKPISACTETLYRLIYSSHGRHRAWPKRLNLAKPKRGAIRARNRTNYINFRLISERPQAISECCEFGHWEGDSVHFTQSKNQRHVTTLLERKSRFAIGILQPSTLSTPVMTSIKSQLFSQPLVACKSLTIDQGTEFSYYQILERVPRYGRRSIKTYYCNPKSPWQKGSVENFNLRLRRFLPRNFDINQAANSKNTQQDNSDYESNASQVPRFQNASRGVLSNVALHARIHHPARYAPGQIWLMQILREWMLWQTPF